MMIQYASRGRLLCWRFEAFIDAIPVYLVLGGTRFHVYAMGVLYEEDVPNDTTLSSTN